MFYRLAIAGMLFTTMSLTVTQGLQRFDHGCRVKNAKAGHAMHGAPQLAMPPPPLASLTGETSLVHVAPGMSAVDVLHLIKMSLDEQVHAVDGVLAHGDAARLLLGHAGELGAEHPMMDITIDGAHSERHVVVFASASADE